MSGAQSICGGEGDGVGVVAGGNPVAATPAKVPGTHAPAGMMAKLVNAYPDGDGGRPVTGKLRSPEDRDHNQTGEPPTFPSHSPCPSEYTPAGSKFIESPTVPE
jgi:hypothetical protein